MNLNKHFFFQLHHYLGKQILNLLNLLSGYFLSEKSLLYNIIFYTKPKYFSKNSLSFSIMPCFLVARLPPPKRDVAGINLSISVPVVLTTPSRKAFSINLRVSSSLSFSSDIRVVRSVSFCCFTNSFH